ncbi:NAD-dependent epimerase/dehydratase family protein [candidate division WOR-3 bacterium]|nr:NAD-dependent epimerase/dehydratase family protein [candidate division WOR-3 bacterium]
MRILVTGGAGFIGSHSGEKLISEGHDVTIIDDLSSGKKENIPERANFIEGDITEFDFENFLKKEKFDRIIHFAAQIDVRKSVADPLFDLRINVEGLIRLLQSASKNGVGKIVFISSAGVMYGDTDKPADESVAPVPVSPYGVSKLAGEHYLTAYKNNFGLDFTILRFTNVYGPRQDPHGEAGVVAIFAQQMISKKQSALYGHGKLQRDYVFVKDVVKAVVKSLDSGSGEKYNISTSVATSVFELYELMKKHFEDLPDPLFLDTRPGELKRSVASFEKARKELSWSPETSLEDGIAETISFFKGKRR